VTCILASAASILPTIFGAPPLDLVPFCWMKKVQWLLWHQKNSDLPVSFVHWSHRIPSDMTTGVAAGHLLVPRHGRAPVGHRWNQGDQPNLWRITWEIANYPLVI
jgi:hypothetical protein